MSKPCECTLSGFCKRFNRNMDATQLQLCQANGGGFRDILEAKSLGVPYVTGASSPGEPPGFFRRAANFARAAIKQAPLFVEAALTGDESKAVRSQEEIERIFTICKGCELYDAATSSCKHQDCGCTLDPQRSAYFSKLAYASAHCPKNPPLW